MPLVEDDEDVILPGVGGWPSEPIPRKKVCEIIEPRMVEIFQMVKDKLDEKKYLEKLNGGIVLTGGGALMLELRSLQGEIFDRPARVGYPLKCGGLVGEYKSPVYSTAVGLVLYC